MFFSSYRFVNNRSISLYFEVFGRKQSQDEGNAASTVPSWYDFVSSWEPNERRRPRSRPVKKLAKNSCEVRERKHVDPLDSLHVYGFPSNSISSSALILPAPWSPLSTVRVSESRNPVIGAGKFKAPPTLRQISFPRYFTCTLILPILPANLVHWTSSPLLNNVLAISFIILDAKLSA